MLDVSLEVKTGLFKVLHSIWQSSKPSLTDGGADILESAAQRHMAGLTENSREALLLHTIEGFPFSSIAEIMRVDLAEVEHLVGVAHQEMAQSIAGRVLIIEDEAVIALDLESLVSELGHTVTGIARTRVKAVEQGRADATELILVDIRLADNSSGIDAVNDLIVELGDVLVIFITAYPERLLTGDRPEPAFLISKPYNEEQVRSAVSQAMFFATTATLKA